MEHKLENINFRTYPKFRHNLWTNYEDDPDVTYLAFSHGVFEIPTGEAAKFLKIRSFCTGFNSLDDIAKKSMTPVNEIQSMIDSLVKIDMLHLPFQPVDNLPKKQIREVLKSAAKIWSEQLADTHISRDIFLGKTTKNVVLGWLLETYHYVKSFTCALKIAAEHADGTLKELLVEYARQEKGHESFIMQSLIKAGLKREEVEESVPLISTRTIDFLLKELFILEPCAVLLVASIIEAEDFDSCAADEVARTLHEAHNFPIDTFDSFFQHVQIDSNLGHHRLLQDNIKFLDDINPSNLHDIVNKIHDIKHAFDLQNLEINDYYGKIGNYFPRQRVDFFAI